MDVVCITCSAKGERFLPSSKADMERHVAIVHAQGTFSTLRCGKCQRKYYDFADFEEHTKWPPVCDSNDYTMHREPLSMELKTAFDNLVVQSMQAVDRDVINQSIPNTPLIRVKTEPLDSTSRSTVFPKTTPVLFDINDNDENGISTAFASNSALITPSSTNGTISTTYLFQSSLSSDNLKSQANGQKWNGQSTPRVSTSSQRHGNLTSSPVAKKGRLVAPIRRRGGKKISSMVARRRNGERNTVKREDTSATVRLAPKKATKKYDPVISLCHDIMTRRHVNGYVACIICKSTLNVVIRPTNVFASRNMLYHSNRHLGKLLFGCKFCDYKDVTRDLIRRHVNVKHNQAATTASYHNHSAEYEMDIKAMISQCFDHSDTPSILGKTGNKRRRVGLLAKRKTLAKAKKRWSRRPLASKNVSVVSQGTKEPDVESNVTMNSSTSSIQNGKANSTSKRSKIETTEFGVVLRNTATELIKQFASRITRNIECLICHKSIVVINRSDGRSYYPWWLVDHAMFHVAKRLYLCQTCGYDSASRSDMVLHVRRNHEDEPANSVIDIPDQFHDEIMDYLKKCFNHGNVVDNAQLNATPVLNISAHGSSKPINAKQNNGIAKPRHAEPEVYSIPRVCEHCGWKTGFPELMRRHMESDVCKTSVLKNIKEEAN